MSDLTILGPEDLRGIEVTVSYGGKIQCKTEEELYKAFKLTNKFFNEAVEKVMRAIFAVINQKENPYFNNAVSSSQFAELTKWAVKSIKAGECTTHFANPFTLEESRANPTHRAYDSKPEMKDLFYKCKQGGERWYSREKLFEDAPQLLQGSSGLISEINQAAIEKVKGYLELKTLWKEGDGKTLSQLDQDTFVKETDKLFGKEEVTAEAYPALSTLLAMKTKDRKAYLRRLYQTRLENPEALEALEGLNAIYNVRKMGKNQWKKAKENFEKDYPDFVALYQKVQSVVAEIRGHEGEMSRWDRDPNFLTAFDKWCQEANFPWQTKFKPPFQDEETIKEWALLRNKNEKLPENWSAEVLEYKEARKLYVEKLKALNPFLFEINKAQPQQSGFFYLLKKYTPFSKDFKKPPGLRFPDPIHHPEPINFSATGVFQYRNLKLLQGKEKGSLQLTLKLISPETHKLQDYSVIVRLDQRLKSLTGPHIYQQIQGYWKKQEDNSIEFIYKRGENEEEVLTKSETYFHLENTGSQSEKNSKPQLVQMGGGNLLYKALKKAFYFQFRFTKRAPIIPRQEHLQIGDTILGVDAGQKYDWVIVMFEVVEDLNHPLGMRLLPHKFEPFLFKKGASKKGEPKPVQVQFLKLPGGTSFKAITHAEKKRSQARKKTAEVTEKRLANLPEEHKPKLTRGSFLARGQKTNIKLSRYIENCRKLRYKQLAGVLVKLAVKNQSRFVVVENLESYKTTVRQERHENKRLGIWSMQKTHDFLAELTKAQGINMVKRNAAYTSQSCSMCGSFGVRYNLLDKKQWMRLHPSEKKENYKKQAKIQSGGDWFLCSNPQCLGIQEKNGKKPDYYRVQADLNAARNIAYKAFYDKAALPFEQGYWGLEKIYSGDANKVKRKELEETLQAWLDQQYNK